MTRGESKRTKSLRATRARLVLPGPTSGRPLAAVNRVSLQKAFNE